jgi:hypothetical protein
MRLSHIYLPEPLVILGTRVLLIIPGTLRIPCSNAPRTYRAVGLRPLDRAFFYYVDLSHNDLTGLPTRLLAGTGNLRRFVERCLAICPGAICAPCSVSRRSDTFANACKMAPSRWIDFSHNAISSLPSGLLDDATLASL